MKKSIILSFLLALTLTVCQNQIAAASKKSGAIKISISSVNPKFFDLGVGGLNDPNNSSILYVIFGDSNGSALTTVKVYISGVLQTGTGVTVSGHYSTIGIGKYLVVGTITRADHTSFSCNGSYDTN